jgi:hypothetical protein
MRAQVAEPLAPGKNKAYWRERSGDHPPPSNISESLRLIPFQESPPVGRID